MNTTKNAAHAAKKYWFMQPICGLPKEAEERLSMGGDKNWVRYAKQFKAMPLKVPGKFYMNTDIRTLYKKLLTFCKNHFLDEELVISLIPSILQFTKEGYCRPMLFVGPPGCGKTTTAKLIFELILGLPSWVVKIPQADTSHGLCGETGTFSNGSIGNFAEAMIYHNNLCVGFVLDEVDKCPEPTSRASISNELLSCCDDSVTDVQDNFLGFKLASLKHCPIIMTANRLELVNPVLADRSVIINFPEISLERMESIIESYTKKKIESEVFSMIDVDFDQLRKTSEHLLCNNIVSIRRHQQLVETALGYALSEAVTNDLERVNLSERILRRAEKVILEGNENRRKVGFGT